MIEDLLRRAIAGDRAALGRLLDANVDWMLAHARRLIANKRVPGLEADEVCQEALTIAVEQINRFEIRDSPEAQFRAWLARIVATQILAAARTARTRLHALESELERDGQARCLSPSRRATRSERLRRLDALVNELPAPAKAVIRHHYILGDRSEVNTARALGTTTTQVHSALDRARRLLRKKMGDSSMWRSSSG